MKLIDADELMEHAGRDKLDSRELITQMIENAQTIDMKNIKNCVLAIVEEIIIDSTIHGVEMAVGIAYSDIEHLFKHSLGVGNQKIETRI